VDVVVQEQADAALDVRRRQDAASGHHRAGEGRERRHTDPVTVFDDTLQVPGRSTSSDDVQERALKVKAGSKVDREARLSESPEVRRGSSRGSRTVGAGAADPKVRLRLQTGIPVG
jgi:hypothetical protein